MLLDRTPVLALPDVSFAPLQSPVAVQLVAFVLLHVSVALLPLVIDVGLAVKVTVGTGGAVTVTVADAEALPPLPVHSNVYVLVAVSPPVDAVPLVALVPDQVPEAAQLVAFVLLQVSVEPLPLVIDVGLAVKVTVGAEGTVTATVADAEALPPLPVHSNV